MSVLDAVTVDLEPTATYARREAQWLPGDAPGEGHLVIRLWKGKRAGSKCESDTYAVQPDGPRAWLLLNLTDPSQKDVYRVDLDPRARRPCTCDAANAGLNCKHKAAFDKLIEEKHL